MRRCSGTLMLLGLLTGVVPSCGSSSNDSDDSGTGADTATSTQGTTGNSSSSASLLTNATNATSATGSAATSTATSTAGINNGSSSGTASSGSGTSGGTSGGAGGEGGSGGDPSVTCPNQPPVADSSCSFLGSLCAYEDCGGAGRTVATCSDGTWFVDSGPCSETVYCNDGSEMCAAGEVCLIRAGGAFLQECVPNTCEGEAVECDCIDGCFDNCPLFATVEGGITITCNTCPSGQCP